MNKILYTMLERQRRQKCQIYDMQLYIEKKKSIWNLIEF